MWSSQLYSSQHFSKYFKVLTKVLTGIQLTRPQKQLQAIADLTSLSADYEILCWLCSVTVYFITWLALYSYIYPWLTIMHIQVFNMACVAILMWMQFAVCVHSRVNTIAHYNSYTHVYDYINISSICRVPLFIWD